VDIELLWESESNSHLETESVITSKIAGLTPPFSFCINGQIGVGKTFISKVIGNCFGFKNVTSSSYAKISIHQNKFNELIHCDFYNIINDVEFFYNEILEKISLQTILLMEWGRPIKVPSVKQFILKVERTGMNSRKLLLFRF
jgi:tRNA A37 threonylcarbamoyladenosine biosynthesis protein TsaE